MSGGQIIVHADRLIRILGGQLHPLGIGIKTILLVISFTQGGEASCGLRIKLDSALEEFDSVVNVVWPVVMIEVIPGALIERICGIAGQEYLRADRVRRRLRLSEVTPSQHSPENQQHDRDSGHPDISPPD